MGIYENINRIYGSSIFDSAVRRKNTFDLKVPFPPLHQQPLYLPEENGLPSVTLGKGDQQTSGWNPSELLCALLYPTGGSQVSARPMTQGPCVFHLWVGGCPCTTLSNQWILGECPAHDIGYSCPWGLSKSSPLLLLGKGDQHPSGWNPSELF